MCPRFARFLGANRGAAITPKIQLSKKATIERRKGALQASIGSSPKVEQLFLLADG
jgi:hypothetical protein